MTCRECIKSLLGTTPALNIAICIERSAGFASIHRSGLTDFARYPFSNSDGIQIATDAGVLGLAVYVILFVKTAPDAHVIILKGMRPDC